MARQRLGAKKHAKCEAVLGRTLDACLVRGGGRHFWAICTWTDPATGAHHSDWVNWRTGEHAPLTRAGRFVADDNAN